MAFLTFVLMAGLYLLPTIQAISSKHKNTASIAVLNLFLGWTLLGWVVSLAWAVKKN